ncbi:hypothetical protein BDM02DRAFT_3129457 [Thelephora ganbajun]|uniref:Uncharacterized protein n=1 Tax=Thelephora ganbajun TaxID=370292 RepID=A0ACB6ZDQ1_THEGA|nr:hypothetical protein BDM02DRAFT_3129457 [Thelephora ganbajun]
MAATTVKIERSLYCTGDTCYLLDDTQPTNQPGSDSLQSDLSTTQSLSSHASSLSPTLQESASTSSESTASSHLFDLESYLYGLCGTRWKIDEFDWVYGSRVVRATKLDASGSLAVTVDHDDGAGEGGEDRLLQKAMAASRRGGRGSILGLRLPRYSSVIMKHSPLVFNEVLGIRLDPYRQTIEAKVLTALHDTTSPLYPITASCEDVLIPELIHHALSQNLLIKTDLGEHPSLDRFILSPSFTYLRARRLGPLLGNFLGRLHSAVSFVREKQSKSTVRLRRLLINSYMEPTLQSVLGATGVYLRMAGVEDYESLLEMASERWLKREKSAFCKGNLSFGTLQVVSKDSDNELEDDRTKIILCDWEFAGPGHPAGDLAQMGAYLHLASLSPRLDGQQKAAVVVFADGFYQKYYSHLRSITDDLDSYRHSLLVFHVCEMVTTSVWKHSLWCGCEDIPSCSHTRATIHMASGLLRSVKEHKVDWAEAERASDWTRYLCGGLEELRTMV